MKSEGGIYWFTTSIIEMQNVFVTKEYFQIIIESFKYFETKRNVRTVLYCVMPNHLHWSFKLANNTDNPIDVYRDFKRHTAKEILKNLKCELRDGLYQTIDLFKNKRVCSRYLPDDLLQIFERRAMNKNLMNEEKFDNSPQSWNAYAEFGKTWKLRRDLERRLKIRLAVSNSQKTAPCETVSGSLTDLLARI